ncbi:succinate dehydrogenase, hydrophobic membrane anchor protein [Saccharobesus litoralis]|uniref:Succinate dehydrogenase hydrophobic membrane anchor subunit n=1 Tax=Saccharobesus litoralis TaxID=2172099 RepID=A0A2S0VMA2_9ALTE|nr:succinate dehydrogenase, hydrophobic membrane anchor protein [Saccharobesus litoralis]AWB65335.1 succinate dehydrogenase, hydrophobic membrane anchor protein [Saccharobesus litoralis]
MVTNAATLGRSGVHDFLIIRASALVLAAYAIFLLVYLFSNPGLTYQDWSELYSGVGMKVFTIISLFGLLAHAWIGLWQVLTDYVKCARLRMFLQFVLNIAALSYFVTGLVVLWGV